MNGTDVIQNMSGGLMKKIKAIRELLWWISEHGPAWLGIRIINYLNPNWVTEIESSHLSGGYYENIH